MRSFASLLFFLSIGLLSGVGQIRELSGVTVDVDNKTVPVRVSSSSPEMNALALQAFRTHGRYRLVASGYSFDIQFSPVAATQVRVDIAQGSAGSPMFSQVVSGTSPRNALLRAADLAVEKTNGAGLKGYFASRLTFIGERTGKPEVYTSDLFFGDVKQVTHDNSLALKPHWSPDGNKIIYTSFYNRGFPDIFLMDLVANRRDKFATFKGTNQGARFSPRGDAVVMVLSGEGTPEIYTANPQGSGVTRRTRSDAVKASPCYSPDGSRIVYAAEPGPQLYVMSAAGGPSQRVTANISRYCAEPDWSRTDPNKIVFTVGVGTKFQIAVLDLSTRESKQVSNANFDGIEPCWLPDGRHVVYTARSASESRVCILDTETHKSVPVSPTSLGATMQASVWAP
jgi:TolB protein